MSMPNFPDDHQSRENVINQILSSIAMEELGLSHIINAEGEKIQFVLGTLHKHKNESHDQDTEDERKDNDHKATLEEVLETNESVQKVLENVTHIEILLNEKLNEALCTPVMYGPKGDTASKGSQGN